MSGSMRPKPNTGTAAPTLVSQLAAVVPRAKPVPWADQLAAIEFCLEKRAQLVRTSARVRRELAAYMDDFPPRPECLDHQRQRSRHLTLVTKVDFVRMVVGVSGMALL